MIVASCLVASLMSLTVSYLTQHQGYNVPVILFMDGLSGFVITILWWLCLVAFPSSLMPPGKTGLKLLVGEQPRWLVIGGVLTGLQVASAFIALNRIGLADANVLMFSAPVFIGLLSVCFGEKLGWDDVIKMVGCTVGSIVVEAPWVSHSDYSMDDRVIGAVAAAAFAVFMGLQTLIISHHLKAESMITVNVYSFAILSGVSWPGLIWGGGKSIADGWSNPVTLSPYLLMSVGVLFLLSFYLRSTAFQLAEGSSTSVAILIYVRASRATPRILDFA